MTASFTIIGTPKTIHWEATYTGSATQGHSFYLTTNPASNQADIALTTSGQPAGTKVLTAGTYYISIRLGVMGPGVYSITYNPSSTGEPHITTINAERYDFQAAGEFILLRDAGGLEIQVRHTPIATRPDPADERAACVSINSAVAARVGRHRVTYEPNLSGVPDPGGLQLRVDGVLTDLGERAIDLGGRGRITRTNASGGLRIDFPDGTYLFVTPAWWADQGKWFLNFDIAPAGEASGIAGTVGQGTWLPALPDGSSMGPLPESSHDRYVALNHKFADAWRVTDANSLFDYASGTSTSTFTTRSWPPERPPCEVPGTRPAEPISENLARAACRAVRGGENANCVYDVMMTGNPGFANLYLDTQRVLQTGGTYGGGDTRTDGNNHSSDDKWAVFFDGGANFPHGTAANVFDPGFSFNAGLEYMFTPQFSAEGIFGYHRLGAPGGALHLFQFSGNVKTYLTAPPYKLRPFLNGGVGAYTSSSGTTRFGGNVGGGLLYEVTPKFGLQGSYNFHVVNTPGSAFKFSTAQGGVRFVF
jgi:hypothetical protein